MNYKIYRLSFNTPVHFGSGVLNESMIGFCADTLFSALYIEALKMKTADKLYNMVDEGKLLISDAFPYIGNQYFLPKPMIYVEPKKQGNSTEKKQHKKVKYVPVSEMSHFLSGDLDLKKCSLDNLGKEYSQVMSAVRRDEQDALPYRVGNYIFNDDCGLYIIVALENEDVRFLLEELLISLSFSGIGGKKSSGKGKFVLKNGIMDDSLQEMLSKDSGKYMLIASALPRKQELPETLEGAYYLLQKRSGFVYSETYADEEMKKRDLYTMQSGSCFNRKFLGDIYDVGEGGNHAVYRYAKGLFVGV